MPEQDELSLTVLLVEDEPLVRLLIADLLSDEGFRVVEAANASEALIVLEAGIPVGVLLADVDMPSGINGYQLAQAVRRRWPEIEILVMSGRHWPAEGDLPSGAAFLAKPCPNESILSHVRAAVERAMSKRAKAGTEEGPAPTVLPYPKRA
jgi:CheY-like chemotaxis protein